MTKLFVQQFQAILSHGLPGERAHAELMPVNRPFSSKALKEAKNYKKSAVGVILFRKQNTIRCILIQRTHYDGAHSRQVSFPGGKMDPSDPDLEYTARRECMEEINLPIHLATNIGKLSHVYIPVSNFFVQPYVFYIEQLPQLTANKREVDEIFSFDIFSLTKEDILKKTDLELASGFKQKNVPYFDIEGRTVWGATAMILSELKAIINDF